MYKHCPIIVACVGFGLLVLGVICTWYAFPKVIESAVNEAISLEEGRKMYSIWRKQPFALKFKLYFFNVTNPDEAQNGANPVVKELGPFVYDLYVERVDVELNDADDTLKYMLKKTYYFNQEDSGCRSDNDVITVINAALVGTALQVSAILPSAMPMISDAMPYLYPGIKDIFLTVKVKDFLFEGVRLLCQDEEVEFVCGAMKGALPKTVALAENGQDFLFSLLGYLNATPIGPYVMGRGIKNTTRGELYMFNEQPELSMWSGRTCNMINGSDSGLYFQMKKPVDRIYTFSSDICRSIYINFEKEMNVQDIKVYKYSSKPESIARSKENRCFCQEVAENEYDCPTDGLLDMTPCLLAPIYMSFPHFYLADKGLLKYASGIKPRKALHESYLIIEPITATPLEGYKRIQMNIHVKPIDGFTLLDNVTDGIFPIFWGEEGFDLPDEYVSEIKSNFKLLGMMDVIKWALIVLGILMMLSSFVLIMYQEKLMCFAQNGKVSINEDLDGLPTYGMQIGRDATVNSTALYPGMNRQMVNANSNNNVGRFVNFNSQGAWHIKM